MKKHLFIALSLFSTLSGMETLYESPKLLQPETRPEIPFDVWDFFSEHNNLDKLAPPILVWDKESYKHGHDIYTVANLHIVRNSILQTNNRIINDAGCDKGHISAFLAQDARVVCAYDSDRSNIASANTKYSLKNLGFTNDIRDVIKPNFYDLIVSCSPVADMGKFQTLSMLLKSQGEIFCIFTTQSNLEPIDAIVFREMLPTIKNCVRAFDRHAFENFVIEHNKEYPLDETLKQMAATLGFEIITFEQKNFTIQIPDINKFKSFHAPLIMNCFWAKLISNPEKRKEIANCFVGRMIKKLKKTDTGNWIYPCSKTIVHIRKTEINR